eukprot:4520357-Prymnesium_polylepis.1
MAPTGAWSHTDTEVTVGQIVQHLWANEKAARPMARLPSTATLFFDLSDAGDRELRTRAAKIHAPAQLAALSRRPAASGG